MQKLVYKNPNGVEIDLTSGNYGVIKWDGFSSVDLEIQSQQVPFQDGSVYLDSLLSERDLSVTVAVNDNNDLEKRYMLEREMITALNPKLGEGELIYTNDFFSKKINCVPHLPKFDTKNMNNSGTRKAMIDFTASNPYWEDLDETIISCKTTERINIKNDGDVPVACKLVLIANPEGHDNYLLNNVSTGDKLKFSSPSPSGFLITSCLSGQKKSIEGIWKPEWIGNGFFGSIIFNPIDDEYWYFNPYGISQCVGIGTQEKILDYKEVPVSNVNKAVVDSDNLIIWGIDISHLFKYTSNGFETVFPNVILSSNQLLALAGDKLITVKNDNSILIIQGDSHWDVSGPESDIIICESFPSWNSVILATSDGDIGYITGENTVSWSLPSLPDIKALTINDDILFASTETDIWKLDLTEDSLAWTQIFNSGCEWGLTYMKGVGLFGLHTTEILYLIDDDGDMTIGNISGCRDIYNFGSFIIFSGTVVCVSYGGTDTYSICQPQYISPYTICKGDKYVIGGLNQIAISDNARIWTSKIFYGFVYKIIWVEKFKAYYAGTSTGLLRSSDGLNWESLMSIDDTTIARGEIVDVATDGDKIVCVSKNFYEPESSTENEKGGIWESLDGEVFSLQATMLYSLYAVIYFPEDGVNFKGYATGKDGGCAYLDLDGLWKPKQIESVNFTSLVEVNKTLYAVGKNGMIGELPNTMGMMSTWHIKQLSLDGIPWTYNINCIIYDNSLKVFFLGGAGIIAYSGNGQEWYKLGNTFNRNINSLLYSKGELMGTIYNNSNIAIWTLTEGENRIEYVDAYPSFDFELELGNNDFYIESLDKNAVVTISYKQKYLGV